MAGARALESRRVGAATVLFGPRGGKYPDGNSVLVRDREERLMTYLVSYEPIRFARKRAISCAAISLPDTLQCVSLFR